MILLAGALITIGAVLVVVGADGGGLAWIYAAIVASLAALVVLALGVARGIRRMPLPAGGTRAAERSGPGSGGPEQSADADQPEESSDPDERHP